MNHEVSAQALSVSMNASEPVLSVQQLSVRLGEKIVVQNLSYQVAHGERLAIVGESGSGKSISALALLRLLPRGAIMRGEVVIAGRSVSTLSDDQMCRIRGREVAMIFQEPLTALNPLKTIGAHLHEVIASQLLFQNVLASNGHRSGKDKSLIAKRVIEVLTEVELPSDTSWQNRYPYQLSGGQRQRILIAMAVASQPRLLIADEPTTALDVSLRNQMMELIMRIQQKHQMGLVLISHDLAMVKKYSDQVVVLEKGHVVEQGRTTEIFAHPTHDYTRMLLNAKPERNVCPVPEKTETVLAATDLRVGFPKSAPFFWQKKQWFLALKGVNLQLQAGETLGVIGESGSGKSTLAMTLLNLIKPLNGRVAVLDTDWCRSTGKNALKLRKAMQVVFQDPYSSLSPRWTIGRLLQEGLSIHFPHLSLEEQHARIDQALADVHLDSSILSRFPHQFSGGQRQRIALARVLVLRPRMLILDEPTSALDATTQKQMVNLLSELQQRYGLAYVLISHDLHVVYALSHRIMVLKNGEVVECGDADQVYRAPQSRYAQTLIASSQFA